MVGREAYQNPRSLVDFEAAAFGPPAGAPEPLTVVEAMAAYAVAETTRGVPMRTICRPLLGLFNGLPGARAWRRRLSMLEDGDGPDLLREAARLVRTSEPIAA